MSGLPEDRDGLFDTIQRSKNHYQKRAYQCIKMMVMLFTHCPRANQMLQTNGELKRKWTWAVDWLHEELERVSGPIKDRVPSDDKDTQVCAISPIGHLFLSLSISIVSKFCKISKFARRYLEIRIENKI